jgi:hypothetical protein
MGEGVPEPVWVEPGQTGEPCATGEDVPDAIR